MHIFPTFGAYVYFQYTSLPSVSRSLSPLNLILPCFCCRRLLLVYWVHAILFIEYCCCDQPNPILQVSLSICDFIIPYLSFCLTSRVWSLSLSNNFCCSNSSSLRTEASSSCSRTSRVEFNESSRAWVDYELSLSRTLVKLDSIFLTNKFFCSNSSSIANRTESSFKRVESSLFANSSTHSQL